MNITTRFSRKRKPRETLHLLLLVIYSDHTGSKIIRFWHWVHLVLQVMDSTTSSYNNTTLGTSIGNSLLGLAVGLPLALIAVVVMVAAVFYTQRFRSANISQAGEIKITEDSVQNVANPRYIAPVLRPQSTQQDPVYANFQRGGQDLAENIQYNTMNTSIHRQESNNEDLYLQCDPQADAIYNNDSSFFSCSAQPDPSYEDEYIMPDML